MELDSLYIPNLYPEETLNTSGSSSIVTESESPAKGVCTLYWNDVHLGYIHDGTAVDYKKTPKVKQYYKKLTPDKPSKELVKYWKEEVSVSLFYSDEKKTMFEALGANEGTLKIVEQDGTEVSLSGMSATADFSTTYSKDGKNNINVTFIKLS